MSCVEVLGTSFQHFLCQVSNGDECLHVTSAQNAKLCDAHAPLGLDVLLCLSAINFPLRRLGLVLKATPPPLPNWRQRHLNLFWSSNASLAVASLYEIGGTEGGTLMP